MASTDRGWIHLRQLVSPGEVDAILAACAALLDEPAELRRRGDRPAGGTRHLMELDDRIPAVDLLLGRPALVDAVTAIVGTGVHLDQVSFRSPQPGHGGQSLHADDVPKLDDGPDRVATAIVALTDFTTANGATRVVPGSHRRPDLQRAAGSLDAHQAETLLTGMRGDAFVFSGHLLHGGTTNTSRSDRPALQITWRR